MPYEIPLYKARLLNEFLEWTIKYEDDPLREDAYKRALRIYNILDEVVEVEP